MPRRRATRTEYALLFMLIGGASFLYGVAGYWQWIMLAGYLVTIAAWWFLARPKLTTRQLHWRRRRRH
jgi:hypothetical protein